MLPSENRKTQMKISNAIKNHNRRRQEHNRRRQESKQKTNKSISICYTVRNRTNLQSKYGPLKLLKNSINSVVKASVGINFEIVISDWRSTDTNYSWIPKTAKLIRIDKDKFSAGYGRNISAKNARYNNLLFLDADMLIDSKFLRRCFEYLSVGEIYFPHMWCVSEKDKDKSESFLGKRKPWNNDRTTNTYTDHFKSGWCMGAGNCCTTKNQWNGAGKWPEYTSWGLEDTHFRRALQKRYKVVREKDDGLIHQWHPSSRSAWGKKT